MTKKTSAQEWFLKAERAYDENHQGCPWCDGAHRVRLSRQGTKRIYSCQRCDFQASHDTQSNRFHIVPGEEQTVVAETMLELPVSKF